MCIAPHGVHRASQHGAVPYKTWAEREVTLDVAPRSPAVGAADIPLCLSNMADVIRTPTPCLSLCLPVTAGPLPFLDSRRIELHGQRSNLQSYARARARRAARNRIRYIPPRPRPQSRPARKFAIADNDTERLMAPRPLCLWSARPRRQTKSLIN